MWRLFWHYLFPIFLSYSASGRLCFMSMAFSGYLHFYCFFLEIRSEKENKTKENKGKHKSGYLSYDIQYST